MYTSQMMMRCSREERKSIAHLSEILSWLLDTMMEKSSDVISDEHLKHMIDQLNVVNKEWEPEAEVEYPLGRVVR